MSIQTTTAATQWRIFNDSNDDDDDDDDGGDGD